MPMSPRHVDHMHADAIIAIAASEDSQALTPRSSATRSAGCRGSGRATSSGCGWRGSRARTRRRRAACSRATGCSPGATTPGCYETTLDVINRAIGWLEARTGAWRPSAARGITPSGGGAAGGGGAADAGDPRHDFGRRADGRAFRRPAGGAGVRRLRRTSTRWRPSARAARTISSAPRSVRSSCPSTPARRMSRRRSPASAKRSPPTGRLRRLLRALPAGGQSGDARSERGRLPGAGRRHDHLRQGQADSPGRRRILRQRDQRDARLSSVSTYQGLPEQEAFDIEYWLLEEAKLKRVPKPGASPAASPSSPVGPAASAGRRPSGCSAKAPAS